MKGKSFAQLGINADSNSKLQQIIKQGKVTWKSWSDGPNGPIAAKWNVRSFPSILVLDQQGVIRYKFKDVPCASLIKAIDQLVKEAETEQ